MNLAIDIGGTKTLIAVFNSSGELVEQAKFPTNKKYPVFISDLENTLKNEISHQEFSAVCFAVPGQIDHGKGVALRFGNLPWLNVPILKDTATFLKHIPAFIQNDAKLAGLYEAVQYPQYKKVVYLTVSTGIGIGVIINQKIDPMLQDSEPGQMMIELDGQLHKWESVASGRALYEKYGQKASEITDPTIWKSFCRGLALGINEISAIVQPEIIVLGGGVGAHYEKFSHFLNEELAKLSSAMVPIPRIIKAKKAEEAVAYGCNEFIKQNI